MEDFAYGVDREQLTDAALRVARRTGARLQELDEKVGLTKTVTSGVHAITAKVNSRTAPVLEKVQQNETVQAVTDATVAAAATVNAKLSEGFSWVHAKLNPPAKVNAPEILTRPAAGGGGWKRICRGWNGWNGGGGGGGGTGAGARPDVHTRGARGDETHRGRHGMREYVDVCLPKLQYHRPSSG
mgnify:CR=1 FL=1